MGLGEDTFAQTHSKITHKNDDLDDDLFLAIHTHDDGIFKSSADSTEDDGLSITSIAE